MQLVHVYRPFALVFPALAAWLALLSPALAQEPAAEPAPAKAAAPAAAAPAPAPRASAKPTFRKLAEGVETTIPPEVLPEETFSTHDIVEIKTLPGLKWKPALSPESRTLYEMASDVRFRRDVHSLELTFKPLRMIYVDIPQPSGKLQKKLIWYMVYRVKNVGAQLTPKQEADGSFSTAKKAEDLRFSPQFVLQSHEYKKEYLDRVIPTALGPIQTREDPNRPLLNSVEMAATPIPLSTDRVDKSVWGVATWEDIDGRMDFFSLYVSGLSNAYKWADPKGVYKQGASVGYGRRFVYKTLKLNFWRPGDEYFESEKEIRFGTAPDRAELYGVPAGVDYVWLYR